MLLFWFFFVNQQFLTNCPRAATRHWPAPALITAGLTEYIRVTSQEVHPLRWIIRRDRTSHVYHRKLSIHWDDTDQAGLCLFSRVIGDGENLQFRGQCQSIVVSLPCLCLLTSRCHRQQVVNLQTVKKNPSRPRFLPPAIVSHFTSHLTHAARL